MESAKRYILNAVMIESGIEIKAHKNRGLGDFSLETCPDTNLEITVWKDAPVKENASALMGWII